MLKPTVQSVAKLVCQVITCFIQPANDIVINTGFQAKRFEKNI